MLYEPEYSLSSALYSYIESDWNDYLNYWGLQNERVTPELSEEDREFYGELDSFATHLRKCVHTLSVDQSVVKSISRLLSLLRPDEYLPTSSVPKAMTLFQAHPLVKDCINIQLGYEAADELARKAEMRIPELLSLLAQRNLSEPSRAYLDRATKLYLWGFDPECVVMCHSVLEAALQDRLPDELVWSHGITKNNSSYTSEQRINAAAAEGLLDSQHRKICHDLRRARNDTLHNAPNISLDAKSAISHLATILDKLFPTESEGT